MPSDLSRAVHIVHTAAGPIPTDHDGGNEESPIAVDKASVSINVVTSETNHVVQGLDAHKPANGDENEVSNETNNTPSAVDTEH